MLRVECLQFQVRSILAELHAQPSHGFIGVKRVSNGWQRNEVEFSPLEDSELVHVTGDNCLDVRLRRQQVEQLVGVLKTACQSFERARTFNDDLFRSGPFLVLIAGVNIVLSLIHI